MNLILFILCTLSVFVFTACSDSKKSNPQKAVVEVPKALEHQFQIGSTWDRVVVDQNFVLKNDNFGLHILAKATGRFASMGGTGTVFYIGKHNGKHLVATNKHVANEGMTLVGLDVCSTQKSQYIGKVFFNHIFLEPETHIQCVNYIGMWDTIDFAILEIKEFSDTKYLDNLTPMKFSTDVNLKRGTEFVSVGYGSHQNDGNSFQKATMGKACRVFSENFLLKEDAEDKVTAWSFATNCDVSSGDSGSALADVNSVGVVHGVFWASAAQNKPHLLDDNYVENLFQNPQNPHVWDELSFAIPSSKILETLESWIKNAPVHSDEALTVKALLESTYQ